MLRTRRVPERAPAQTVAVFDCEVLGFRLRGCFLVQSSDRYEIFPPTTAMTPAGYAVEIFSKAVRAQIARIAACVFEDLLAARDECFALSDERARTMLNYAKTRNAPSELQLQISAGT